MWNVNYMSIFYLFIDSIKTMHFSSSQRWKTKIHYLYCLPERFGSPFSLCASFPTQASSLAWCLCHSITRCEQGSSSETSSLEPCPGQGSSRQYPGDSLCPLCLSLSRPGWFCPFLSTMLLWCHLWLLECLYSVAVKPASLSLLFPPVKVQGQSIFYMGAL